VPSYDTVRFCQLDRASHGTVQKFRKLQSKRRTPAIRSIASYPDKAQRNKETLTPVEKYV
jgi:hypothetical protein